MPPPRNRLLAITSLFAVSVFLSACSPTEVVENKSEPVRPVKTIVVKSTATQLEFTYSAVVLPAREVELSFRVSGRITELPIRSGVNIKKGDIIAQLDKRDFEAEISRLKSQIEQAEAQLAALTSGARAEDVAALEAAVAVTEAQVDAASDQLSRTRQLFERRVVARAKLDADVTSLRIAEAKLAAKEQELIKGKAGGRAEDVTAQEAAIKGLNSNLQSLNDNLSDATLRAPFDGIIATRNVENFSNIQAKETIATLQELSTPNLIFDIPASDIPTLAKAEHPNLKAMLDSIPGREFKAERSEFSTKADPATQTYRGRVSIQNPDAEPILPGMTGVLIITVEQAEKSVLSIPSSAITSDTDGSPFVWVISNDANKVMKQAVTMGEATGSSIAIVKGLNEGDVVAIAGLSTLQENMVVKPVTSVGE